MDYQKIQTLIELINASDLSELTYQEGDVSLTLQRQPHSAATSKYESAAISKVMEETSTTVASCQEKVERDTSMAEQSAVCAEVQSPLYGVVYLSPSENEQPYVCVGDEIVEGQTLALLEAMKMFHPIQAETAGTVKEIRVESGTEVESGQVLFLIG